jgi:hypothetical protein
LYSQKKGSERRSFVCKNSYEFFEANQEELILAHHGVSCEGFSKKEPYEPLQKIYERIRFNPLKKNPLCFFFVKKEILEL